MLLSIWVLNLMISIIMYSIFIKRTNKIESILCSIVVFTPSIASFAVVVIYGKLSNIMNY
jgi:hypothetical protein